MKIIRFLLVLSVSSVFNIAGATDEFFRIAATDNVDQLTEFLKANPEFDVNTQDNDNKFTALMVAVEHKNKNMVQALINNGAKLELQTTSGSTAIFFAKQEDIAQILINAGADINFQRPSDGVTALMFAAQDGNTGVIRALLNIEEENWRKRANPNLKAINGTTVLQYARWNKDIKYMIHKAAEIYQNHALVEAEEKNPTKQIAAMTQLEQEQLSFKKLHAPSNHAFNLHNESMYCWFIAPTNCLLHVTAVRKLIDMIIDNKAKPVEKRLLELTHDPRERADFDETEAPSFAQRWIAAYDLIEKLYDIMLKNITPDYQPDALGGQLISDYYAAYWKFKDLAGHDFPASDHEMSGSIICLNLLKEALLTVCPDLRRSATPFIVSSQLANETPTVEKTVDALIGPEKDVARLGKVLLLYTPGNSRIPLRGIVPPIPPEFSIEDTTFKLRSMGITSTEHIAAYCLNDDSDWYIDNDNHIISNHNFIKFEDNHDGTPNPGTFDDIKRHLFANGRCKSFVFGLHNRTDATRRLVSENPKRPTSFNLVSSFLIYERIDSSHTSTTTAPDETRKLSSKRRATIIKQAARRARAIDKARKKQKRSLIIQDFVKTN